MFALRAAQPGTLSPLPRARTRSEQPPARAGRAAGPGPVHAADAGARGTVVRTAAAAALDRRVRAGSGLWEGCGACEIALRTTIVQYYDFLDRNFYYAR